MTEKVYWTCFELESIKLHIAATEKGLCYVALPNESLNTIQEWVKRYCADPKFIECEEKLEIYLDQIREYFLKQRKQFSIPMDLKGTPFQLSVWRELAQIPFGETRTYSQIANKIGNPQASRAVGAATGRNPLPLIIPCHRVVGKNGKLTGFRGGLSLKNTLLQLEGHEKYNIKLRDHWKK